jgi:hypothetical protein
MTEILATVVPGEASDLLRFRVPEDVRTGRHITNVTQRHFAKACPGG